jgi:hypothetical protein
MSFVIQLLGTAAGETTEFDGKYVVHYDPTYVDAGGYDGGILEVTTDRSKAQRFPDKRAAFEKWREPFGIRQDGQPNRPLTAWTVSIIPAEE